MDHVHSTPQKQSAPQVESEGSNMMSPPVFQLQANPAANPVPPAGPVTAAPAAFDPGNPASTDPLATQVEQELRRLAFFKMGHADHGRSELLNPFPENDAAEIEAEIVALTVRFLPAGPQPQRDRLAEMFRRYLEGVVNTMPADANVADHIERQRGGFDAMASLISEHSMGPGTGGNNWDLSSSPELMQVLHDMGYWEDLDRRVVNAAEGEYADWTDTTSPDHLQRSESDVSPRSDGNGGNQTDLMARLTDYWRSTGMGGSAAATNADLSSRDASVTSSQQRPWSAAFISHVMRIAGAGDTFRYAGGHAYYGAAARENGTAGRSVVTHPSRLFNAVPAQGTDADGNPITIPAEPVHVGGLIHRHRGSGSTGVTYENLTGGMRTHADLIVAIEIYDAQGQRVPGNYTDIIANTDRAILDTYQIFAVSIGGNTADEQLQVGADGHTMETTTRERSGRSAVAHTDDETTGRRFWPLHSDLTIDNSRIGASLQVYGIQRMQQP